MNTITKFIKSILILGLICPSVDVWTMNLFAADVPSQLDQPPPTAEKRPKGPGQGLPKAGQPNKPSMSDTIKATIYADNWFCLYINGELRIVDPISFLPHNVVQVDILPSYPMTIAVMVRDNADPKTGMEYNNTQIGDGGFIPRFSDGTVTNGSWKVKCVSTGPLNGDMANPQVRDEAIPANWQVPEFNDSEWEKATVVTQEEVGPKPTFFDFDFTDAQWIWSKDLKLDNLVLLRYRVAAPPSGAAIKPPFVEGYIDAANHHLFNH